MWTAHRDGTANHGMRLWSILWLELWLRTFIDRGDSVVTELIPAVTTRHM
jgi:hypothetical protein